jgi:hypothetical protein
MYSNGWRVVAVMEPLNRPDKMEFLILEDFASILDE